MTQVLRIPRTLLIAFFLLMIPFVSSALAASNPPAGFTSMDISQGWEFRQVGESAEGTARPWYAAQVPGDVHLDLLRNKLIPDPFYRDNEGKLQWIEDADWEYRTVLQATPELLKHKNVDLVFEGLDAAAEVYLNDALVLKADNMFREWRVNVRSQLKPGANQLRILFPSPIKAAAKVAATDAWRQKTGVEAKTYIRKAAYEYGWDWGPRFVTSGIWRPCRLEAWDAGRISDLNIAQRDVTPEVAHLNVQVEITAAEAGEAKVTVGYAHAGKSFERTLDVTFHQGLNLIEFPVEITKPNLWYPTGYGTQAIYEFNARLRLPNQSEQQVSRKTGLRSIVLKRELDAWGRSFALVVNGIPIFGKGADVIPFDSFPNRVTTAQYRRILESARDANMNMIRHWGGGYYETQEFYDLCDELGIMVWQDFMFGNDWQPGTYAFKLEAAKEAEYQLRRLRNHPSIVLWCGNNETEVALSWNGRERLDPETRFRMWQDYLTLFSSVIERTVNRLAPNTPYWPSSPSADYEDTSEAFQTGDGHDWSVWHGRVPFTDYQKHFSRFFTEYGFQSFPEMKTVEAFTEPKDRSSIFTPVMLAHQKNNQGNSIIHDYLLQNYSEPRDFASFLYVSQVLQAEGIKVGAEHMRRNRPRIMGSIYWQLNDCWPVASWSSIDYFGRWKALQYYARRFYSPLLVSPVVQDGKLNVYVVSDRTVASKAQLRVRVMTLDGKVISDETTDIAIPELSSKNYVQKPLSEIANLKQGDFAQIFAATDLLEQGKSVSSNLTYFVPTKEVQLPAPQILSDISGTGGVYRLRLSSSVLARSVYVSSGELDAQLSDNYFDVLPGQPVEITVKSTATVDKLKEQLKMVSLADAFGTQK